MQWCSCGMCGKELRRFIGRSRGWQARTGLSCLEMVFFHTLCFFFIFLVQHIHHVTIYMFFADPVLCKCWRMTDECVRIYITFDVLAWVRPSSESANFIPRWRPDPGRNVGRNEYFCMSVTYIYGRLVFKHQSMKKLFFYLILFSFVCLTVIRDMYRFAVTGFYCATQGRVQHSFVLTVCSAPSVLYLSLGHISLA